MRYLIILLLLGVFTTRSFCRPLNDEESEGDEADYESDGAETDDAIEEEEESRVSREESSVDESSGQGANRNTFLQLQRVTEKLSKINDNLSNYNPTKNSEDETFYKPKSNNEYQPSEQRDTSRFNAKNLVDQPEPRQFSNRDDSYKSLRDEKIPIAKQAQAVSNEESEVLFERNDNQQGRQDRTTKNDYERAANSQFRYSKQFYNSMQDVPDKYSKSDSDRDKRAAQDSMQTIQTISTVGNEPMNEAAAANAAAAASAAAASANAAASNAVTVNSASADAVSNVAEDEEAAIKRHVKKLSAEELEELLNSLSEDKRQLLKKIMDSDTDINNDINKREITKKAGAAPDDNSYLEGGESDASKLVSDTNSQNSATESTDINKQNSQSSDVNVLPVTTKSADTSNDTTFSSLFSEKKVDSSNTMDSNNRDSNKRNNLTPDKVKTNKREVNSGQLLSNQNSYDSSSFNDDDDKLSDLSGFGYFCPQDKDSDFDNDQSELYNKDGNTLKREISDKENEDSDAMKSLAESFPNSISYDDNDSGSDSAPLVRVKRKNLDVSVKKRSANVMPDAKVAYFPYRAENDDEDNDEGNEFDDEGFYNPTSSLAKNYYVKDTISKGGPPDVSQDSSLNQTPDDTQSAPNRINAFKSNNKEGETANLGSDTDSVLSGGEGIDENLMFNSASRNKRASDAESSNGDEEFVESPVKKRTRFARSTVLDDEINSVTENYANDANYHEKEPLNPLPGNYEGEGDSVRYKRIRGVKQPSA